MIDAGPFLGITPAIDEVHVTKSAAQLKVVEAAARAPQARVIDIRTGEPWRPPEPRSWPFLCDVALTVSLMSLGAWLFLKMQGG